MKTWVNRIFVIALILATLSGCAGKASSTEKLPPLKVEWSLWEGDYTLLLAKELGFFEKHGVEVEPIQYEVLAEAVPDLAGHVIDGGLFTLNDLLTASRVADVSAVLVYDTGGVHKIIATPAIQSIADLRGKRVGVQMGSHGEMFMREMLRSAGLTPKDVIFIDAEVEQIPSMLTSEIQAGYTWEPFTTEALAQGNHVIYTSANSPLAPDVIMFRREVIENRPEDIRAFVSAWFEAVDYRLAHPAECNQLISKLTGQPVEDLESGDNTLFTLRDNLSMFAAQQQTGSSIYNIANINLNFMISIGLVTQVPDFQKLLDPSFLVQ